MTRTDYRRIAAAVHRLQVKLPDLPFRYLAALVSELSDSLAEDNPRFDRARFFAACIGMDEDPLNNGGNHEQEGFRNYP